MIRDLVKELRIFERNKVPEEIKILGIAIPDIIFQENCKNSIRTSQDFL